jgi:hypothetical protein
MSNDKRYFDTICSNNNNDFNEIKDCYIEINSNDNYAINPTISSLSYSDDHGNSENLTSEEFTNYFLKIFSDPISLDEDSENIDPYLLQLNTKHKKKKFEVIYPGKNQQITTESEIKYDFTKKIRSKNKQPRFTNWDNIRRVIKRRFVNTYLKNKINMKLKKEGYETFIESFPQEFAANVTKEFNRSIINMTFGQILKTERFYSSKKLYQYKYNYKKNSEIVNSINDGRNSDLKELLNKKFSELFEEYLNSNEFKINEIQRLRNSKKSKDIIYIKKYEHFANNLIEFFAKKD